MKTRNKTMGKLIAMHHLLKSDNFFLFTENNEISFGEGIVDLVDVREQERFFDKAFRILNDTKKRVRQL